MQLSHIWEWFIALHETRAIGWAAGAISYTEIDAFGRLMGCAVLPWEAALIRLIDRAWLLSEDRKRDAGTLEPGRAPLKPATGKNVLAALRSAGKSR